MTPAHSIIIPHRARQAYLIACLRSITRSAAVLKLTGEYEVIVVNAGRELSIPPDVRCEVVFDCRTMPIFNKSALLNLGINEARGEILTFLDADAIVGPRWLEAPLITDWNEYRRACYRVRYIDDHGAQPILAGGAPDFERFDDFPLAYEAYGNPNISRGGTGEPWGNSQFSIHRRWLGAMRYDEAYVGRGFEDLDLLNRMARSWGRAYRGRMFVDPDHAMFHMKHGYAADWRAQRFTINNVQRFRAVQVKP